MAASSRNTTSNFNMMLCFSSSSPISLQQRSRAVFGSTCNRRSFTSSTRSALSDPAPFSIWRMQDTKIEAPTESIILNKAGVILDVPCNTDGMMLQFSHFFSLMTGSWNSERTYHYMGDKNGRESSQTTFDVRRITDSEIGNVLRSNGSTTASLTSSQISSTNGFNVSFLTKMASMDELVRASTNLAFVPESLHKNGIVRGSYYRDLGYEDSQPIKASFTFDVGKMELLMTTYYSKVVSVDQISLINPSLRLRKIVNYRRPAHGQLLQDVLLVGFGVEKKSEGERLVS